MFMEDVYGRVVEAVSAIFSSLSQCDKIASHDMISLAKTRVLTSMVK